MCNGCDDSIVYGQRYLYRKYHESRLKSLYTQRSNERTSSGDTKGWAKIVY